MPGAQSKRDRNAAARGARRNEAAATAGPAPFDGPGSNAGEARGRSGSVAGTRTSSRPGSQVRGSSQTRQAVDPARDPVPQVLLRNVDFGGAAYNIYSQVSQYLSFRHDVRVTLHFLFTFPYVFVVLVCSTICVLRLSSLCMLSEDFLRR